MRLSSFLAPLAVLPSLGLTLTPTHAVGAPLCAPLVSLCHTSQGNGFNWAASLGWLSESFDAAARESNGGTAERFDVSCLAGSSSAAGTVTLLAALLGNSALGWSSPVPNPARFTADDLRLLARALRVLAMAADFGADEKAASAARHLLPEENGRGSWWKSQYGENLIRHVFARRVLLAANLRAEDLEIPVGGGAELPSVPRSVSDLVEYFAESFLPLPGSRAHAAAERFLQGQQAAVSGLMLKRLGFDVWSWNARADAYLARTPAPDGFLTTAFALLEDLDEEGRVPVEAHPPAFPRARKVVFANGQTLRTLLASPAFRAAVREDEADTRNFVLAEVTTLAELLRPSLAEPENQRLVAAPLTTLGVRALWDPHTVVVDDASPAADTTDAAQDGAFTLGEASQRGLVILGGWTNPETTAWPLTHFQLARAAEAREAGWTPRGVAARFGKPGRKASFPRKVLATYFHRDEDGALPVPGDANLESYLNRYYSDMDAFEGVFAARADAERVPLAMRKDTYDWDIAKRPAAAADLSQELFLGVVGALRVGKLDARESPVPAVFIPRPID
jgi:hypothetical protein